MTGNTPIIQVVADAAGLARAGADLVVRFMQEAIVTRGRATLAVSGGSTPQRMFSLLAGPPHSTRLDFDAIDLFFVDERCVGPDDPASNYNQVRRLLLDPAGVPSRRVHRIRGEQDPAQAAADYERELRSFFPGDWPRENASGRGLTPSFDLVLLGIGPDGHTASLFPGQQAVREAQSWVVAATGDSRFPRRVTLTLPAINHARQIAFMVDGPDKAGAVGQILSGQGDLPAAKVHPVGGQCHWLLTESAAGGVVGSSPACAR
jgi:6-phosphogluconolactonase